MVRTAKRTRRARERRWKKRTMRGRGLLNRLKNKYATYKTRSILNENFENVANVAGQQPGEASRNLLRAATPPNKTLPLIYRGSRFWGFR